MPVDPAMTLNSSVTLAMFWVLSWPWSLSCLGYSRRDVETKIQVQIGRSSQETLAGQEGSKAGKRRKRIKKNCHYHGQLEHSCPVTSGRWYGTCRGDTQTKGRGSCGVYPPSPASHWLRAALGAAVGIRSVHFWLVAKSRCQRPKKVSRLS